MNVPERITSAAEALAALDAYVAWRPPVELGQIDPQTWSALSIRRQLQQLLDQLDQDPNPGPVVEVVSGGNVRRIGRPLSDGRDLWRVVEPDGGPYGLKIPRPTDALAQLVSVAVDVTAIRALAARAARCAEYDHQRGRTRQGDRMAFEAAELATYATADLERHIEPLAAGWLSEWRREAARRAPQRVRHPLTRTVELRTP